MTQPFSHVDAATLIGSWPIVPDIYTGVAGVLPKTMLYRARILGVLRESAAGFDVHGRSLDLDVDASTYPLTFVGSSPLTLQEVVDQINTAVGFGVAHKDNGFLRLESPTVGQTSYLRVRTNPSSSPTDVIANLGMFPGTESYGGDLEPAQHIDPDRQVAYPGQLSWLEGEPFEARVFNRALLQLGINTDRTYGLLERKRMGKAAETSFAGGLPGFTISGTAFVGTTLGPGESELEDVVTILDDGYNEVFFDDETLINTYDLIFEVDVEHGKQEVRTTSGVIFPFGVNDPSENVYLVSSDASLPAALQGVPMKIVDRINGRVGVIQPIDPVTGDNVLIPGPLTVTHVRKVRLTPTPVKAVALWTDSGKTQRVEQIQFTKATETVTRVEQNNRIVCIGASFIADGLVPGDLVEISGASATDPYSNNDTYRVGKVFDDESLELVSQNYGPVVLNHQGAQGTATIKSDGDFFTSPYVELNTTPPASSYRVLYKAQSTMKEIVDADPGALSGSLLRFKQEADYAVQDALMRMWGPSATNFNDVLYGDVRHNMEDIYYQLGHEHYMHDEADGVSQRAAGRHRNIRPDRIDMYRRVDGETVSIRNGLGDSDTPKVLLWNSDQATTHFMVNSSGRVVSYDSGDANGPFNDTTTAYSELLPYGHIRAHNPYGISLLESRCLQTGGTAYISASGNGSDSRAHLWLDAESEYSGVANDGDGATALNMRGARSSGDPIWYCLSTRPGASALLKLDVVQSEFGPFDSFMVWAPETPGVGIMRNDPAYTLDVAGYGRFTVDLWVNRNLRVNNTTSTNYGSRFQALNVWSSGTKVNAVMDSDPGTGAEIIFHHEAATPVADQNFTEFIGVADSRFLVRALDDGLGVTHDFLGLDLNTGMVSAGKQHASNWEFTEGIGLEVHHGIALGDHDSFAGIPSGHVAGETLAFIDAEDAVIFSSQDGSGMFNQYHSAYFDGADHRVVTANHMPHRVETSPDMGYRQWSVKDWKQAALAAGDIITWRDAMRIDGESNVTTYEKLKSIGTQEFEGPGLDRMHETTRVGELLMRSYDERPGLISWGKDNNSYSVPDTMDCACLDGKFLWGCGLNSLGSIYVFRVDVSSQVMSTATAKTSFAVTYVDNPKYMTKLGDYLFVACQYNRPSPSAIYRWRVLKINVKDPDNPYVADDYYSPTASTGGIYGMTTDGWYVYVYFYKGSSPSGMGLGKLDTKFWNDNAMIATVEGQTTHGIPSGSGTSPRGCLVFDGTFVSAIVSDSSDNIVMRRFIANPGTSSPPTLVGETTLYTDGYSASSLNLVSTPHVIGDGQVIVFIYRSTTATYLVRVRFNSVLIDRTNIGVSATQGVVSTITDGTYFYNYRSPGMSLINLWDRTYAVSDADATGGISPVRGGSDHPLVDSAFFYAHHSGVIYRSPRPG